MLFPRRRAAATRPGSLAALAELLRERARRARDAALRGGDPHSPWHARDGWRLNAPATQWLRLRHGTTEATVAVDRGAGRLRAAVAGTRLHASAEPGAHGRLRRELDGPHVDAAARVGTATVDVFLDGPHHVFAGAAIAPRGGGAAAAGR